MKCTYWGEYIPRDYDLLHIATCPNCQMNFKLTQKNQKYYQIAKEEKKEDK